MVPDAIRYEAAHFADRAGHLHRVSADRVIEWRLFDHGGELLEIFWLEG